MKSRKKIYYVVVEEFSQSKKRMVTVDAVSYGDDIMSRLGLTYHGETFKTIFAKAYPTRAEADEVCEHFRQLYVKQNRSA